MLIRELRVRDGALSKQSLGFGISTTADTNISNNNTAVAASTDDIHMIEAGHHASDSASTDSGSDSEDGYTGFENRRQRKSAKSVESASNDDLLEDDIFLSRVETVIGVLNRFQNMLTSAWTTVASIVAPHVTRATGSTRTLTD